MKVYITIVDTITGIYQSGMIDEPVVKGQEIANALAHFGISYGNIKWDYEHNFGHVEDASKIVSVITIKK